MFSSKHRFMMGKVTLVSALLLAGCGNDENPTGPDNQDTTSPAVSSTVPANGAADVAINRNIYVTFNKAMDPATITTASFTLTHAGGAVSGTVTYSGTIAALAPASNLAVGTLYTATMMTAARDLAGHAMMANEMWTFTTGTTEAAGPSEVILGTAGAYVILAKSGISTTGTTDLVGNVGVSPAAAAALTGFSQSLDATSEFSTSGRVTGRLYAADYAPPTPSKLTTAVLDMQAGYTDAAGRILPDVTELGAGDIDGMTLVPGLYQWGTGVNVANGVTLAGGANDVWIFQIAQDLNVGNGAAVTLSGGAKPQNIFWQVGGHASLGTTSHFRGVVLCQTHIVLNTGAVMDGRALAQTAVTLDAAVVTSP